MENERPCENCGAIAVFESGEGTPHEGDVCTGCGIWVCIECSKYGQGESPFCPECFAKKDIDILK